VKRIDRELYTLNDKFDKIETRFKAKILSNQFAFQDFFAHNIYKQELKNGTISKYPNLYFETEPVKISEELLWGKYEYFAIINEWENEAPKLKFLNIGNYLLFFKAVYFSKHELSLQVIKTKDRMTIDVMKENYEKLDQKQELSEDWSSIENYLIVKGLHFLGYDS